MRWWKAAIGIGLVALALWGWARCMEREETKIGAASFVRAQGEAEGNTAVPEEDWG